MFQNLFRRLDESPAVKWILFANVLFFLASYFLPARGINLNMWLGMYYFGVSAFKPWQIITHMFMHANFSHIFFNMFNFVMFGMILEKVWGAKRFLMFYFFCGLGAAFLHQTVQAIQVYHILGSFHVPDILPSVQAEQISQIIGPVIGASGAVYGVMAAFAMLFPNTELYLFFIPVPIKAKYVIGGLVLIDLFSGVTGSTLLGGANIAHFAHVGGALFGILMVLVWRKDRNKFY